MRDNELLVDALTLLVIIMATIELVDTSNISVIIVIYAFTFCAVAFFVTPFIIKTLLYFGAKK